MKTFSIAFCAAAALVGATPALSQEVSRFSLGVTAGTLGIGPEASVSFGNNFALRGNVTLFSIDQDFDSDDINYKGDVDLKSGGLMLDFHPTGGGFRVSVGARINGNKASVVATPTTDVDINGETYTPGKIGTLRGSAETKNFAPMLTIGYSKRSKGFALGIEAGALFQGNVRINRFTASNNLVAADDLEAERRSIQDDVDGYKVYPVLQLSAGYRF